MTSGDGADGIEFLDDAPDEGVDEELPGSEQRRPGRGQRRRTDRRLRLELAGGAVVLGLALLIARAVTHHDHEAAPSPSASAASPAASAPAPTGSTVRLDPSTGRTLSTPLPVRSGSDPTLCPGLRCYVTAAVSGDVRAAIRASYPSAVVRTAETIRLVDEAHGNPLWYCEVVARIDRATLTLRVQAHAPGDQARGGENDDGSKTVTFDEEPTQQWLVRVEVTARSGTKQSFDRLEQLASDPRVLTVT